MNDITECEGYKKLIAAVEADERRAPGFHDYRAKLKWIVDRAIDYSAKTGLNASDILDAWESRRNYWYMNFYQECNQPEIVKGVRVFETVDELLKSIGSGGFRCPNCGGVSSDPYSCNSGLRVFLINGKTVKRKRIKEPCNWKSFGLFGTMGKGVTVFVKSEIKTESFFMPVSWECHASQQAD